jgi:hypothetical protein
VEVTATILGALRVSAAEREQLRSLVDLAGLANVDMRIVPDHGGWHPGLGGPFVRISCCLCGSVYLSC